jgi:hypothetical protein
LANGTGDRHQYCPADADARDLTNDGADIERAARYRRIGLRPGRDPRAAVRVLNTF